MKKKSLLEWDTPSRIDTPELIDDPDQPYSDFRASMIDVQRANRFLGGTSVITRQIRTWFRAAKANPLFAARPIVILDVATGSGDLPKTILKIALQENVDVRIVALDFSEPILRFAREEVCKLDDIRLIRGDAYKLPFSDSSFDFVLCSLAFHHLGFAGSIRAMKEMERVSKHGWLVNDLRRAWSAWYLFRAVSCLLRMNRLTRHDGPASVLRAYSISEYRAMPETLGLQQTQDFHIRRSLFYRAAIVREKNSKIINRELR